MKTKSLRSQLSALSLWLLALCVLCVLCVSPAFAQSAPALNVIAAPAAVPFYASGEFWTGLFGVAASLVAIWRNGAATNARKINDTLVLGIEEVTKLPGVAEHEQRIKTYLREKATDLGVQPLLHRIVQDLTEPAAKPAPDLS